MAESTEPEYTYTAGDKTGFEYYILGPDVKKDFNFLRSDYTAEDGIAYHLEKLKSIVKDAAANDEAFYVNTGSSSENTLHAVKTEIDEDISRLYGKLNTLYQAFMKDIDNVNAELDMNFGYWVGRKLARHEAKKKS